MPKRGTPKPPAQPGTHANNGSGRPVVVGARATVNPADSGISPPNVPNGSGFGWSSLLSGFSGEPDEEDHEGWVERLFGNERSGATSPPQPGMLGLAQPPTVQNAQAKNKRQRRAPAGGVAAVRPGVAAAQQMLPAAPYPPQAVAGAQATMVRATRHKDLFPTSFFISRSLWPLSALPLRLSGSHALSAIAPCLRPRADGRVERESARGDDQPEERERMHFGRRAGEHDHGAQWLGAGRRHRRRRQHGAAAR